MKHFYPVVLSASILFLTACGGQTAPTPGPEPVAVCPAASWVLRGSATQSAGRYNLTDQQTFLQGAIFNQTALDLRQDFDCSYQVFLGDNDEGADGIVYTWVSALPSEPYEGGEGLNIGFGQLTTAVLGVEMDTWQNDYDPLEDHIALLIPNRPGQDSGGQHHLAGDQVVTLSNLEDNREHTLRVVWNANSRRLRVFLDGTQRIEYTVPGSLGNSVFVGFTSGTGIAFNVHYVKP